MEARHCGQAMSPKPDDIRVLIVDDHKVVADGLSHLLRSHEGIEVVGIARSGREAVRRALELDPDVVVMDSNMPDLNGIEATRQLHERGVRARVIMLSVHAEPPHVVRALRAGASGYVPKSSAGTDVIEAIETVHAGKRFLHSTIAQEVLDQLVESEATDDPVARLSPRERQVLQLIAEGKGASEIAPALSLSVRTVETYRARLMEKLDIHDVPSLVKFAIRHGLTSLD
jgi:DNA-binding NarL/FixJ family response regulator